MERTATQKSKLSMVVVMGATGAGKSHFINKLAGPGHELTQESDSFYACTQRCLPIPLKLGGTDVLLIDTPGFDEALRPDTQILTEIAKVLVTQYKLGVDLKGIIYIQRINDARFTGSASKTLRIFERICGDGPLTNVLMVTSGWSNIDEGTGSFKEGELRDGFWSHMLDRGSCMSRFHGDRDSALMLVSQLLQKKPVVLQIQRELVDDSKELKDTAAGAYLFENLETLKEEHQKTLRDLEERKRDPRLSPRVIRRVETDLATETDRLRRTEAEQVSLNRCIANDVDEVIDRQSKRRRLLRMVPFMVPFLSIVLDILFGVLGIPSGFSLI